MPLIHVFTLNCLVLIICLYVDDMLIFGSNLKVLNNSNVLIAHFEIKDLGGADVILGVKIRKTEFGFSLF